MIHSVRADNPNFRAVTFTPGLNIVVAERTAGSSRLDSRNGVGKSTLIDIIHFCLGSSLDSKSALRAEAVAGWVFALEFDARGRTLTVFRSPASPNRIQVSGLPREDWPQNVEPGEDGLPVFKATEWNAFLGTSLFGLPQPPTDPKLKKYRPTVRSLLSYLIRRRAGYSSPFLNFPKQAEWDRQVNTAYLLGLDWSEAREWQLLRDREAEVGTFEAATETGFAKDALGSQGQLEAVRVRLAEKLETQRRAIAEFKVHPQYQELAAEATALSSTIHDHVNRQVVRARLIANYRKSVAAEQAPSLSEINALFEEARLTIPDLVRRRLSDVQTFHEQVVENRRSFLETEIARLLEEQRTGDKIVEDITGKRARLLGTLKTHGALEELNILQSQQEALIAELQDVTSRLAVLQKSEQERSNIRIDREVLAQRARANFAASARQREAIIGRFNANSEALYSSPGVLVIDIGKTGFKFDVEIERSSSHGVEHMKIFCYDVALADTLAARETGPRFLIHDSMLYDPVDERQRALALEIAANRSSAGGWQYICTINSDMIPRSEFSTDFNFDNHVRLKLADAQPSQSLLGVRF